MHVCVRCKPTFSCNNWTYHKHTGFCVFCVFWASRLWGFLRFTLFLFDLRSKKSDKRIKNISLNKLSFHWKILYCTQRKALTSSSSELPLSDTVGLDLTLFDMMFYVLSGARKEINWQSDLQKFQWKSKILLSRYLPKNRAKELCNLPCSPSRSQGLTISRKYFWNFFLFFFINFSFTCQCHYRM